MTDFLPKGTEIPAKVSKFLILEIGKNVIRAMSSAKAGWEWWAKDEAGDLKPYRVKSLDEVPPSVKKATHHKEQAHYFWAFMVWNVGLEAVQLLEITQVSILRQIEALLNDSDWGSIKDYDIVIEKKKTGSRASDVEYTVLPRPKKKAPPEAFFIYENMLVDLEKLFEGKSPFKKVDFE